MRLGMVDKLGCEGLDDLLFAILALSQGVSRMITYRRSVLHEFVRTVTVSLGAFTGRPLALTGARVPAASAFLWSR